MKDSTAFRMKCLPFLLTALRAAVTCWLVIYTPAHFGALIIPVAVSILVLLTDFFDGRLARRLGCPSRLGAALDVAADFFYIASFGIVLCYFHVLPLWFILVIVAKFLEFVFTSKVLNQRTDGSRVFVFDWIGRISAASFYVIPIMAYMSYMISRPAYRIVNPWLLLLSAMLAVLSSVYRIYRCIKKKPD